MKRKISLLILIGIIAGSIFSFYQISRHPERLHESLINQLEEALGATFSYQDIQVVFGPFPSLRIKSPRLESATQSFSPLTAGQAEFDFQFFPLLWGQVRLAGFKVQEAEADLPGLHLQNIAFKVKGLGSYGWAPFEWKGRLGETEGREVLGGRGKVAFKSSGRNWLSDLGVRSEVTLESFSFSEGQGREWVKRLPGAWVSGALGGRIYFEKEKGTNLVRGEARFRIEDATMSGSSAFSISGETKILWDLKSHSVELGQIFLEAPFGKLEGRSVFNVETGEIAEVRLTGRKVVLDELIRHFPALSKFLPLDTGFSGLSDFDLSVRGTWDYLGIHGNWNLTPAVVTFGKVFSKPKDRPLVVHLDLILKKEAVLAGDFSVRVQQTTLKGSLADVDVNTGMGELTLITNKFDLSGWNELLIPFSGYTLSGSAKILVNWKGNLTRLSQAQRMVNLTLEGATLLSPAGRGFRNAHVLLDTGPLSFRLKDSRLEMGGSPVEFEAEVATPYENPQFRFTLSSPALEPFSFVENLQELAPFFFPEKAGNGDGSKIKKALAPYLPEPFPMQAVEIKLKPQPNRLVLESFSFRALGGEFRLQGEMDWPSPRPHFWLEAGLQHVALARYFEGFKERQKIFEGNLFFNGRFEGQGFKAEEILKGLTGHGSLSLTNGEWFGTDLQGTLRQLESGSVFSDLPAGASGSTLFNDLKSTWTYGEGKFNTKDFLLHSGDLWVEGEGNLSLDGSLNSRLAVYLSKPVTERVLKSWQAGEGTREGQQLGPIPLLLIGPLEKPELRADESKIGDFLEAVRSRRFRYILKEPLKAHQV